MKYGTLVRLPEGCDLRTVAREKFAKIREMGLESCQLVYKPKIYDEKDADPIREAAEEAGVEISAMFCGYYDTNYFWDTTTGFMLAGINSPMFGGDRVNYLLSAIPFIKRLGVTDMVIHAGFVPNDPYEAGYVRMLAAAKLLAKRLGAAGLNLLFETGMESPIALLNLISDMGLDNVYVNFDTANLILYGYGNPVDAMYTFGKYVRNVHAKDGFPPMAPKTLGKEVPLGEGLVDFRRVFELLIKEGYDRYITIEREISDGKEESGIIDSIKYLKSIEKDIKDHE